MASYFTRFESMLERWQSRRKTIVISSAQPAEQIIEAAMKRDHQKQMGKKKIDQQQQVIRDDGKENNQDISKTDFSIAQKLTNASRKPQANEPSPRCTTKATNSLLNFGNYGPNVSLVICGLLMVLISLLTISLAHENPPTLIKAALQVPIKTALASRNNGPVGRNLGLSFVEQLANTRPRWTLIPGDGVNPLGGSSASSGSDRQPSRWERRTSALQRLVNRISSRIGARNSIRVHNAFRDFAWRILSSLSMPTPVIYELRRQHLYTPEDDQLNDSLFNRNTSMSVRTKRLLRLKSRDKHVKYGRNSSDSNFSGPSSRASSDDEEEDEPENLRDRLRLRFDDLMSLSRRSLFGRVIRVPSLFPFKRQEGDEEQELHKGASGGKRRRLSRRKRKKESDRQMISINGKQYYVNDNGELKELNNETSD